MPKEKLICAMGNYGYDWTLSIPPAARRGHKQPKPQVLDTEDLPVSEAWQRAHRMRMPIWISITTR